MIHLSDLDLSKAFEYENAFYHTCDYSRMAKLLAHWDFFQQTWSVFGDVAEFGVFKGVSLLRFAMFRQLMGSPESKKIIGFDTFDTFPETQFGPDQKHRTHFIEEAGEHSISVEQLKGLLAEKKCERGVELVAGDVTNTLPQYIEENAGAKFSLVHLDVDILEPCQTVLEYCWPRMLPGAIMILDDYGRFPGETKAVDEFFKDEFVEIQRHPFCRTPAFIIKE